MSLLTVMPVWSGDAPMAEHLLDWIFQLRDRKRSGSLLIVCYGDTHEEMRIKLSIAAEVAYDNFDLIATPEIASTAKSDRVTHVFNYAAGNIAMNYRSAWLWLEPDCVPLKRDWLETLDAAYQAQPKRHFGPYFMTADRRLFLGRTAIFSHDLSLKPVVIPQFALAGSDAITPASQKTYLIQQIYYKHPVDLEKIKPEACLLHSDKSGMLINHLREKL